MPKKAGGADISTMSKEDTRPSSQKNQLRNVSHLTLHARLRATYSTVNSTTRAVSMPNQTRALVAWNAGIVSRMVTSAESRMSEVVVMWMRKADGEEFGCSSSACRVRFHGCRMAESGSGSDEAVMAEVRRGKNVCSSMSSSPSSSASACSLASAGEVRFALDRRAAACGRRVNGVDMASN